ALGPVHWANIKSRILVKAFRTLAGQLEPLLGGYDRLEMHGFGGGIHPHAMQIEIGRHTFEGAGAIEHRRAEPGGVIAHAHDRDIPFTPFAFVEGPGLRPILSRHGPSPSRAMRGLDPRLHDTL